MFSYLIDFQLNSIIAPKRRFLRFFKFPVFSWLGGALFSNSWYRGNPAWCHNGAWIRKTFGGLVWLSVWGEGEGLNEIYYSMCYGGLCVEGGEGHVPSF